LVAATALSCALAYYPFTLLARVSYIHPCMALFEQFELLFSCLALSLAEAGFSLSLKLLLRRSSLFWISLSVV